MQFVLRTCIPPELMTKTSTYLTEMIGNALLTLKNYGGYNKRFFPAVFRLAELFSGCFSVDAENIQLGG